MKVLCIGEALIDMICTDTGKTLAEGQYFLKKPGGAPTNVAAAIAALGGKVHLAAKVGVDPFGQQLISVMNDFGVSTKWMLQDEHHFTTMAFVSLMHNGERDFVFSRGADGMLTEAEADAIPLVDYDIIHFGSATAFLPGPLQAAYNLVLQKAAAQNIFISFDPNYRHLLFKDNLDSFITQSWEYIKRSNFIKLSDEEATLITSAGTVSDAALNLRSQTSAVIAITLGSNGTLLYINNQQITVPSIPVSPVDTTGAGDAFVGAVLYQLSQREAKGLNNLNTMEWQTIFANANKAGARTCEHMGAMEAFKKLTSDIFL